MKHTVANILLIGMLAIAGCNASSVKLAPFASEAGKFSISAPTDLEESQQSVQTPVGPIDIHTFTAETKESAFVVAYSDYPAAIVTESDPQMLLDSSRDGAISNLRGTLVQEEKIELESHPGRSLLINATTETGEPAVIDARIYLVNNRLYQILVVTPEKDTDPIKAAEFLNSFTLN